jgi:glycine/D-amino acid oxidase-like deaminating enzyme
MDTVIIGSGIIGLSTAFYLSESTGTPPENIHLVDSAEELFECASGYAAGFLAADCRHLPPHHLRQG